MSAVSSLGASNGVQQAGHKHHHKKAESASQNATAPTLGAQPTPPTSKKLDKTV